MKSQCKLANYCLAHITAVLSLAFWACCVLVILYVPFQPANSRFVGGESKFGPDMGVYMCVCVVLYCIQFCSVMPWHVMLCVCVCLFLAPCFSLFFV